MIPSPQKKISKKFRNRVILTWFIATLLPIFVMIGYIAVIVGPAFWGFLSDPQNLNEHIWQLKKWNQEEFAFRYLNNVIIENPEELLLSSTYDPIINDKSDKKVEWFLLIRKGDEVKSFNDFNSEEGVKIANKFKSINGPILPEFGGYYYTKNEELFDKTGYIVQRQMDFYFSDGDEGSLFFLTKVVNVPGEIGKFVANYFIVLFIILIIMMVSFLVHATLNLTKNFDKVVTVIHEVSNENFEHRLDIVTEPLNQLTVHLNQMIEKLAEAKTYRNFIETGKTEFISNMTHDIKTPLTSIKVQVEALSDGVVKDPDQINHYYKSIQTKLTEIDKMMNELQLFNELETQTMNFDFNVVDLKYFFDDIVNEWQYDPYYSAIQFEYEFSNETRALALIDPIKLKRVSSNVLTNTLKYANVDPIVFYIKLKVLEDVIEIDMVDNGNGIPNEELDKVFMQYYRIDPARNQQIAGSGLGLAICKSIIDRHNGQISAYNDEKGGFGIKIVLARIGETHEKNIID